MTASRHVTQGGVCIHWKWGDGQKAIALSRSTMCTASLQSSPLCTIYAGCALSWRCLLPHPSHLVFVIGEYDCAGRVGAEEMEGMAGGV